MPGARLRTRPSSATESDEASDEASQLERNLQQQLQDDIARIFDESIYSDLEVVCGKLKILTHSCILKARTNRFYRKLETILHVNIGRNSYDEIYSFISDAYTECNIKLQEQGIITYLDKNLKIVKTLAHSSWSNHEDTCENDVFLTPKGVTPYIEKTFLKSISHSPSTELTKEYYALVPIEGNLLDKELIEQDALSNAFQTIIETQSDDLSKVHLTRNKPTSLSLRTSHSSKTIKHSSSCDILTKFHLKETKEVSVQDSEATEIVTASGSNNTNNTVDTDKSDNAQFVVDKGIDSAYSPDSLITDDPSSSSDYLSAAYTCSPGAVSSGCLVQLNVGDNTSKMENIFPSSDSGLENTCLLESLNSHKDVTLTDVSLTESTLHDMIDDAHSSLDSTVSPLPENKENIQRFKNIASSTVVSSTISDNSIEEQKIKRSKQKEPINNIRSSKEEKQRQNEEIVILESSSLSSETGSWESVFPPKLTEKEACENFLNNERKYSTKDVKNKSVESDNLNQDLCPSLVQKSPFKTTSCFIDASSLVDEEDNLIKNEDDVMISDENHGTLPPSSQPVPCTSSKVDKGQNDWSESNDDSLEQTDNKDPDSIQKDLSPTIFEMTPITEDSLCFENAVQVDTENKSEIKDFGNSASCNLEQSLSSSTIYASSTPHNSIMSLPSATLDQFKSEGSESDTTIVGRDSYPNTKFQKKYNESSPIISGGASVEDHLPQISNTSSLITRKNIENIPIVSGAYIHKDDEKSNRKSPKPSSAPVWIVDMSNSPKSDSDRSTSNINIDNVRKFNDKPYDNIQKTSKNYNSDNCNKSRSSVDSDSSERLSQKFYIDFSSLPDPSPSKNNVISENVTEKKNIFSMYIDISEKSTGKDMPPSRLSSSSYAKKNCSDETKSSPKPSIQNDLDCPPASTLTSNDATNTFETYETLCNDPNISISEIIRIPERTKPKKQIKEVDTGQKGKWFEGSEYQETVRDIKKTVIHEEPTSKPPKNDLFVKLSDLDKPCQKTEISVSLNDKKVLDVRMTRSIPDNTWRDQSPTVTSSMSSKFISSFHSENALSLNRLFPHLKNEFSRSMPGSLSSRTRSPRRSTLSFSPGEVDEQASDMSEVSSMQSSMCRSVIENSTTEETSPSSSPVGNCQSRLGQDLLRMFIEEIAPDVIVEVSGRRIKAHKCILSSRFSFNVVHFALCHIYSGVSTIPDSISIVELATIADMLCLEGLKEAIMFTLKTKYCHHFHRPCSVCTAGVLECFPLSSVYGLDDLYRKCLKWITKYFHKVWPTKAFATLPKDLLDKCFRQVIINMTTENFVDTVNGCAFTVAALNSSRWADVVARLCRRLLDAASSFAAAHLAGVLRALAAAPPQPAPAARALRDCLACAIEWAPPDETCAAYAFLTEVVADTNRTDSGGAAPEPPTFLAAHAADWRLQCECALVKAAPRAVATQAFKNLPPDLRKRLREFGCVVYEARALPAAHPSAKDKGCRSYHSRNGKTPATAAARCSDIDHVRASFVPYSPKPVIPEGVSDVKKSQRAAPLKIRTTRAQEERAKYNLTKKQTSQERLSAAPNKAPVRHQSFEKTKPRYLEPRACKEAGKRPPTVAPAPKKKLATSTLWSSSESSRNSSPLPARGAARRSRGSPAAGSRPRTADLSADSLADPQPANIYATYTKNKPTKEQNLRPTNCSKPTSRSNKTKIPVYLNPMKQSAESRKLLAKSNKNSCERSDKTATVNRSQNRINERKVPCSLMNATKSSSAKMVPKVVKEPLSSKSPSKRVNGQPKPGRQPETEDQASQDLPLMERSGTFLKDEPTFGDKTTLIDID